MSRLEAAGKPQRARVRARLADVAAVAGTSKPIASRILNDDPTLTVGEELRRRVLDAARELGYRPHAAARSLRRAATGALGLLVPSLGNPVYTQLMRGAFRRAGELGFTVVLAEDFEEQEAGELFARLVLEGRIDGLMIGSIRVGHPLLPLLAERPVPHVFVNRGVAASGRNVVMDDSRAVELAVRHLAGLGHRSLAHLAGPAGLDPVERRAAAFRAGAARLGLARAEVVHGGFLEQDGVEGARLALERWPDVTAIFAGTVSQALGVLNVAWERGLRVPGELSVLAHADNQLAEYSVPPLTAVRMPLAELGTAAVTALVVQIESGAARDVLVDAAPQLTVRASTARPRAD